MNTQGALLQVMKGPRNMTHSVLSHQANLRNELLGALDQYIVGQVEAKEALVNTLIDGLFNVYREQGALGAVFLGGPTGVGKTELVRSLSAILLGDANGFTKINGNTMSGPGEVGSLVGSSAGYIGYGDTPLLSDKRVHAGYKKAKEKKSLHPLIQGYNAENFSIVLVDEIEKAHKEVPDAFLDALQSGEMVMKSGKEGSNTANSKGIDHSSITDLRNTLFVFTSNIGEHAIKQGRGNSIGFAEQSKDSKGDRSTFDKELKRHFSPEFLGRMDAVIRCHSITPEQIRHIFALNIAKMNRDLAEKGYFSSIRVETTREFVEHILATSKNLESGARAISGIIKGIGTDVGFAIQSGNLRRDAKGIIGFDIKDGSKVIQLLERPSFQERGLQETLQSSKIDTKGQVRTLVEGKINRYGDQVRDTVQEYLKIIASYDTGFQSICRILEKRLRGYGFNSDDIHSLQAAAFLSIYESVDQPASYEIIVRGEGLFEPVGFRPIEKYLRTAIVSGFTLENIYKCIRVLLKRPMVLNEAIVISQHIHRLVQQKKYL